ncbi:MAG: biotin/lipoyl-binding protein, partial [Muribaculaceae bacterium]|nr:biotin/lipoyl-binding protein [Muribaculaceae bacterium]
MIRIVSSHKALLGPIILLLSLTACGHKEKITGQAPVRVEIRCVDLSHGGDTTVYSGTVEPATTSPIGFKVAGTITSLSVGEGDRVVRGQVLGHLSSGDYANASNIAEAELAQARDAYARLKKLHDADALPEIKWVEVQNKLKQAENAAEISRRALDDATLVSPVSGYVGRKFASVGQSVVPAEPVYEL